MVDVQDWQEVVTAATRAPSIHNTQPWRFTASADRLEVHYDPDRSLPVLDPSHRQQVISCGAAVEFAAVALRAAGRQVAVDVGPDPGDPDHLATLRVLGDRPADADDASLAAAIGDRHTTRDPFLPQEVPAGLFDRVQREAGEHGVWVSELSGADAELVTVVLLQRAEEAERGDPAYRAELEAWLRTDPQAVDGIPVGAVPADHPATRSTNWPGRDFLVGRRTPRPRAPVADDDPPPSVERPTVLLLGTMGDDRTAWVQAGRALGRVLLRLTAAGLSAAPMTQALDWPATRTRLQVELSLVGHPQMLLRLGWPSVAGSATGRRPVAEVLTTR
ncbi:nitroreductase [Modestobacter muralis]|uniref:Nitroreductase n=1 Tax=Modestobacter muralis TaxID=1608614 RepID=A0A6P0EXJ5_9ACTN|nr:nitroreductase [Modestobacter muralis]NEK95289.1 nitroreductase [Modestobacter muralis]NEN52177.1 nitroreductase [Modestobacter muralis]